MFLDRANEERIENANALIDGNLIASVSTAPMDASGAPVIDGGIIPGSRIYPTSALFELGGPDRDRNPEAGPGFIAESACADLKDGVVHRDTLERGGPAFRPVPAWCRANAGFFPSRPPLKGGGWST